MQATRKHLELLATLPDRAAFLRVQKTGQKWVAKGVVVEAADNNMDIIRCGLTVSKKISKLAVVRNRVRRRLRAAARDILPLHVRPGVDIVLIGRAETAKRSYDQLKGDLLWCLGKLGRRSEEMAAGDGGGKS